MNYTEEYDTELLKSFSFFNNYYPLTLPFIGKGYSTAKAKMLFVEEYFSLPKEYNNAVNREWYDNKLSDYIFSEKDKRFLNTRGIIDKLIGNFHNLERHNLYKNIGNIIAEVFDLKDFTESLPLIAIHKYFLRPVEVNGFSIMEKVKDKYMSFKALISIIEVIDPNKIFFISPKSKQCFFQSLNSSKYSGEKLIDKIDFLPSPMSKWWNLESQKYGNMSGKDRLKNILQSL